MKWRNVWFHEKKFRSNTIGLFEKRHNFLQSGYALYSGALNICISIVDNDNDNDLLTDPLGGSSLLNYIDYNYKINRIKLFTNYTVELQ